MGVLHLPVSDTEEFSVRATTLPSNTKERMGGMESSVIVTYDSSYCTQKVRITIINIAHLVYNTLFKFRSHDSFPGIYMNGCRSRDQQ